MADDASLALQAALVQALKADSSVSGLVTSRVYDEPPQGLSFPFIRVGNIDARPYRDSCTVADEVTFSIECHSRPESGRVEAARMAAAVRAALDQAALTVVGHTLEWLDFTAQTVIRAADGKSYIATVAFEASLAKAP